MVQLPWTFELQWHCIAEVFSRENGNDIRGQFLQEKAATGGQWQSLQGKDDLRTAHIRDDYYRLSIVPGSVQASSNCSGRKFIVFDADISDA